jgi:catechol 2,3-dioxygenase-like lactoylglutathione lyase family enzyme
MLSVFLACDDLYESARFFTATLGWELEFATPPDSGDPLACVRLGDARVMLGPAEERWLPAAARDHRGAGITLYVNLGPGHDIAAIYARHASGGVTTSELAVRPWGEEAFDAVIAGYRFLIAAPVLPTSAR